MSEKLSVQVLADGLDPIVAFTYADASDRLADTNRTPSGIEVSIDKVCRQVDTGDLYFAASIGPVVWRPLSPPSPSGYDEITSPVTTTSGSLVDITGLTFTITSTRLSRIHAMLTFQASTTGGGSNATGGWACSIDSVDGTVLERFLSGTSDTGIGAVQMRSAPLAPGTYTIKGRHRRSSGTKTLSTDAAQLFGHVVGT